MKKKKILLANLFLCNSLVFGVGRGYQGHDRRSERRLENFYRKSEKMEHQLNERAVQQNQLLASVESQISGEQQRMNTKKIFKFGVPALLAMAALGMVLNADASQADEVSDVQFSTQEENSLHNMKECHDQGGSWGSVFEMYSGCTVTLPSRKAEQDKFKEWCVAKGGSYMQPKKIEFSSYGPFGPEGYCRATFYASGSSYSCNEPINCLDRYLYGVCSFSEKKRQGCGRIRIKDMLLVWQQIWIRSSGLHVKDTESDELYVPFGDFIKIPDDAVQPDDGVKLDVQNKLNSFRIRSRRKKYLEILDLPRGASKDDIKRRYRELSLIYHPDKVSDQGVKEIYAEIFRIIVEAKDALLSKSRLLEG